MVILLTLLIITVGISIVAYVYVSIVHASSRHLHKAHLLFGKGQIKEALSEMEKAVGVDPYNPEVRWNYIEALEKAGKYLDAIKECEFLLENSLHNEKVTQMDIKRKLASLYFKIKSWNKAFKLYLEIFKESEGKCDPEDHFHIGVIYTCAGYPQKAIPHLRRAAEFRKDNPEVFLYLGMALTKAGLYREASGAFKMALKVAPEKILPRLYMACILYELSEFTAAADNFHQAGLKASDARQKLLAFYLMGDSHKHINNFDEALIAFEKAEKMAKITNARKWLKKILYAQAMCYAAKDEFEKAIAPFEKLRQLDASYKNVTELIEAVNQNNREVISKELARWKTEKEEAIKIILNSPLLQLPQKIEVEELEAQIFADNPMLTEEFTSSTSGSEDWSAKTNLQKLFAMKTHEFYSTAKKIARHLGLEPIQLMRPLEIADVIEGEGVDILCKKPGSDFTYLVAVRRWHSNVGDIPIRNMTQRMAELKARRGIFITTSDFLPAAVNLIEKIGARVQLINGRELEEILSKVLT